MVNSDKRWKRFKKRLVPGAVLHFFFTKGNINNHHDEVRAVIDDRIIVLLQSNDRYHVQWLSYVRTAFESGHLHLQNPKPVEGMQDVLDDETLMYNRAMEGRQNEM